MLQVSSVVRTPVEDIERMEQMGEYLVRRLVGEGGMGKVYEAEERLSKRRVALKVLHSELSKSDQARKLFLNEMQILARIEHPNIVRSLASMEVGGDLVMVLEYLDGRTLRHVITERVRLPWVEAVGIVAAAASALAAAHGQNPPVIHRDLKPENIMVLADGSIKVMDFGIAKVVEAMNQTNTQSVGTLQYMSPEQIDAHAIDHRSDLYCLGLILYELLEGKPPFTSSSPRQLLNLQCTAEPPELSEDVRSGLPKGVEELLFQLLEKAPEDRPYLAEDIVSRLEPFIPASGGGNARSGRGGSTVRMRSGSGVSSPRTLETPDRTSADGPRSPSAPSPRASVNGAAAPDSNEGRASAPARGTVPAASAPAERLSAAGRSRAGNTIPEEPLRPEGAVQRADTIALLDRADRGREVPITIAVAIIVVLSLVSGLIAYFVRATSASTEPSKSAPAASESAKSTSEPKAGARDSAGDRRYRH
ncbi:MAG: protein kinase [Polyangiaceae bacterium]